MQFLSSHYLAALTLLISAIHLLGVLSAVEALYWARTSQSAIAWGIVLILFPYGALPVYWIFGRTRFRGYDSLITSFASSNEEQIAAYKARIHSARAEGVPISQSAENAFERLAQSEFTGGNSVTLLVDGPATFDAMFEAIDQATKYVFVQFYILRDDTIGRRLADHLKKRAAAGVSVSVLYDEIGSVKLTNCYIADLVASGVKIVPFAARQGFGNFFQLNFRNHRKIVIVDGTVAFVGGHNVGDEYMGPSVAYKGWRDTHLEIRGPAVPAVQETFLRDWYWATRTVPEVEFAYAARAGDKAVLPIPSGPVDETDRCILLFLQAIHGAKQRLWIATPYFVPDDAIMKALELAVLRGVDVRIILPGVPDSRLVWWAAYAYVPEACRFGARVFRYQRGFMHQKVFLADDSLAAVGTVNVDSRSFRLNFELMVLIADREFNAEVAAMLERDFADSLMETCEEFGPMGGKATFDGRRRPQRGLDYEKLPLVSRWKMAVRILFSKFARLLSPIL